MALPWREGKALQPGAARGMGTCSALETASFAYVRLLPGLCFSAWAPAPPGSLG